MQETITQKELEVQESEDKYKKYIEKARNVMKSMDPKQVSSTTELTNLRNQVVERQKVITDLEVCIYHITLRLAIVGLCVDSFGFEISSQWVACP